MKYLLSIVFLTLLSGCAVAPKNIENPNFYLGGFDGVWIGDVQQIKGTGYPFIAEGNHQISMMLTIAGDKVSLSTGSEGKKLTEVKFDLWQIQKYKTNAIIYAQNSESKNYNEEDKGDWVETWNMTITHKDNNGLYIYLVRAVNNFHLDSDVNTENEKARFFFSFQGELKKIATIEKGKDH